MQSVVRDCLSGNEAAWSAFFTEYASIAMNILNRRLGDLSLDEKEDIIQNTFSKLLKGGLKNFRGSTVYEFLAYFRRIVMNEALTYLKSKRGGKIPSLSIRRQTTISRNCCNWKCMTEICKPMAAQGRMNNCT